MQAEVPPTSSTTTDATELTAVPFQASARTLKASASQIESPVQGGDMSKAREAASETEKPRYVYTIRGTHRGLYKNSPQN